MKKEKKFTKEQMNKSRDYQLSYSETYVEPRGMKDNPIPQKER